MNLNTFLPRSLKPEFSAYVNRLRDLQAFGRQITQQAIELRDALGKNRLTNRKRCQGQFSDRYWSAQNFPEAIVMSVVPMRTALSLTTPL